MTTFRSCAIAVTCVVSLAASSAFAWGAGVEVGAMGTSSQNMPAGSNTTSGTATFGVILEQPFHLIPLLQIETWEDFQTPFNMPMTTTNGGPNGSASYWAVDAGARLGLDLGLLIPYAGIVGQLLILSSTPTGSPPLNDTGWALGGDLGLDLSLIFLKIGVELRYLSTLSNLPKDSTYAPSSVQELEFLGSVRIAL